MKKLLLLMLVLLGGVMQANAWNDMYLICNENSSWNVESYAEAFKFVKVDDTHYRATVPGSYITNGNWNFRFREKGSAWWNIGPIGSEEKDNTEVNGTAVQTNYQNSGNASFYVKKNVNAKFVQIFIEWADPYWKVTAGVITDTYTIAYVNPDNWTKVKAYAYYNVDNCPEQHPLGDWSETADMTETNNYYTTTVPAIAGGKVIFTNGERTQQHPAINNSGYTIVGNGVYGSSGQVETVNVSAGALGKSTFSSEYPLNFDGITTVKAYRITSASNGVLGFEQVTGSVPAGIGLYIEGEPNANYNVPTCAVTYATTSMLVPGNGTAVNQTVNIGGTDYTNYILTKKTIDSNDAPLRFYKVNGDYGNTVPKGKAYLQIPSVNAGSRESFWFDNEATGIANLNVNDNVNFNADAPMYNLAGQRVSKSYKGVVIVNGKKMLNK